MYSWGGHERANRVLKVYCRMEVTLRTFSTHARFSKCSDFFASILDNIRSY